MNQCCSFEFANAQTCFHDKWLPLQPFKNLTLAVLTFPGMHCDSQSQRHRRSVNLQQEMMTLSKTECGLTYLVYVSSNLLLNEVLFPFKYPL